MVPAIFILSILGLSIGSFLNVCIYRIPRGISVVYIGSFCPSCNKRLKWYEIIPLISYLTLGRICSNCNDKIPSGYFVIEVFTALLSIMLFLLYGFTQQFLFTTMFILIMLLIAVIDWQHLIIPNKIVFTGLIIGILLKLVLSKSVLWQSVVSSLCAFMLTLIVLAAGSWLLRKPAMGIGDVKLAAVIGLFIGIQNFLIAFWLATLLGMTFGFYKYLSSRKVDTHLSVTCNMQSTIKNAFYSDSKLPFGSFLAVSSCFVFVLSDYINQLMELWTI